METITTLTHITDVGTPHGNGSDSTERIRRQYQRLGIINPHIVSAGQSPLHVAFTACTDVSETARARVRDILSSIDKSPTNLSPIALNSAPRNDTASKEDSEADCLYKVSYPERDDFEDFLVYGNEVVSWILAFRGRIGAQIEAIKELDLGENSFDTRNGSQFRSAEHLPIIHYLEAIGQLDRFRTGIEPVDRDTFQNLSPDGQRVIVAPPDEYGNGRLITTIGQINEVLPNDNITIDGISAEKLAVRHSLTEVIPGELSVWPSSNHFPVHTNNRLETPGVLNIGTRWSPGETRVVDNKITEFLQKLSQIVGSRHTLTTQ